MRVPDRADGVRAEINPHAVCDWRLPRHQLELVQDEQRIRRLAQLDHRHRRLGPGQGGQRVGRSLEIEVDLRSVDGQQVVVRVDAAPGLAVLPRQSLAGEAGGQVPAEVDSDRGAPSAPVVRNPPAHMKPGGAPRRSPRVTDPKRFELALDGLGVRDRLAAHEQRGQLKLHRALSLWQCASRLRPRRRRSFSRR